LVSVNGLPLREVLRQMAMDRIGAQVLSGLKVSFRDGSSQLPEVIFTDAIKRTSVSKADKKRMRAEYERLYLKETSHS
jgi:hypothetical protein